MGLVKSEFEHLYKGKHTETARNHSKQKNTNCKIQETKKATALYHTAEQISLFL